MPSNHLILSSPLLLLPSIFPSIRVFSSESALRIRWPKYWSLTVWITTNWGKFFKRWEYQTTLPASWEICMQVKKQQLEPDMEKQTGSKLGKEYIKAVYCPPAYLIYMQSTSWEMLDWMKRKLESRLPGDVSITSDMQMTPPYGRKQRGTKEPLEWKRRVKKLAYNSTFKKLRSWHLVPSLHGK